MTDRYRLPIGDHRGPSHPHGSPKRTTAELAEVLHMKVFALMGHMAQQTRAGNPPPAPTSHGRQGHYYDTREFMAWWKALPVSASGHD